jgi:hypothetical protein
VRHEEEDEEEYGHNEEMARLERYSEGARDQALLVKARVDDEVEVVLVFKVEALHYHWQSCSIHPKITQSNKACDISYYTDLDSHISAL